MLKDSKVPHLPGNDGKAGTCAREPVLSSLGSANTRRWSRGQGQGQGQGRPALTFCNYSKM